MKKKAKEKILISSELIKNTLILSLFSIVGKVLGAIFKIPLTNVVGAEGMGYYQMVFPIFVLLFTISSCGISTAITMKIAENKDTVFMFRKKGLLYCFVCSMAFILLLCLFAKELAIMQGNVAVYEIYYFVALAIVGVSFLNVLKSILRGLEAYVSYAIAETIEQIAKVVFSLLLATIFVSKGITKSINGVFVGISLSTIFSILFCLFAINKQAKNKKCILPQKIEVNTHFSEFKRLAFFSTLGLVVVPFIQFVDSILIINLLQKNGFSASISTALFGLSRGTVATLLNLPTLAIISLELVLLPMLLKNKEANKDWSATAKSSIFITFIICSPFVFLYLFFPHEIINLLYSNSLTLEQINISVSLLKIGAFEVLFAGLLQVSSVVMQGIKNVTCPILALGIAGITKIILLLIFIPKFGVLGAEFANIGFYMVATIIVLNSLFIKGIDFQSWRFFMPFVFSGIIMIMVKMFYNILISYINSLISFLVCGIVGVGVYVLILIFVSKNIERKFSS